MQSRIDINICINVLFSYMNENKEFNLLDGGSENNKLLTPQTNTNPENFDPLKDSLENGQPINKAEAVENFKETMFVSEENNSNLENPIVPENDKIEKQQKTEQQIAETKTKLNDFFDKAIVSVDGKSNLENLIVSEDGKPIESTTEMEVPKPPQKIEDSRLEGARKYILDELEKLTSQVGLDNVEVTYVKSDGVRESGYSVSKIDKENLLVYLKNADGKEITPDPRDIIFKAKQ